MLHPSEKKFLKLKMAKYPKMIEVWEFLIYLF